MKSSMKIFAGRTALLATMHGKEAVIAPLLEQALGVKVLVPEGFDTDCFGTFTREVKREGSQRETLLRKAEAALREYGGDLVIASEGSFGQHPAIPFVASDLEMVLLKDLQHDLEIVGLAHSSETNHLGQEISSGEDLEAFLKRVGFPEHGVILRYHRNWTLGIRKDIRDRDHLFDQARKMLSRPFVRSVYLETDMRAHLNPTRMQVIREATEDLLEKIQHLCPSCDRPGFSVQKLRGSRPCELCGGLTDQPEEQLYCCGHCGHEKVEILSRSRFASAQYCPRCNP